MAARALYLRIASLINTMNRDAGLDLDPAALRLLEAITNAHAAGSPLKVTDAVAMDFASHATLHKKLDTLKALGYVQIEHPEGTRRTKYLVPTEHALGHFDALGKALIKAAKKAD